MYNRKLIFAAACTGMLFFGISLITLGSVMQALKEKYQLDALAAGILFSILPLGILVGSLLFGPLCDRYGYKRLLVIACCCLFAGFEGIAYAPSQILLQACVFLAGLGGGAVNGATNALVSDISEKEKGADLSLLGVFFGIGALGMPFVLGMVQHHFSFETIVSRAGFATLLVGMMYGLLRFPPPKQTGPVAPARYALLVKDPLLLLIAFFLFCQSSFEAIINNWTTNYLSDRMGITVSKALYALSLFVAGMTLMRFLLGSVLRTMPGARTWAISFGMVLAGLCCLALGHTFNGAVIGLVLLGAGLAGGFPIMLGYAGSRYKEQSGTAFSLVLVVALLGNMLVNYGMGIVVKQYGIRYLVWVAAAECAVMAVLCVSILNQLKKNK